MFDFFSHAIEYLAEFELVPFWDNTVLNHLQAALNTDLQLSLTILGYPPPT